MDSGQHTSVLVDFAPEPFSRCGTRGVMQTLCSGLCAEPIRDGTESIVPTRHGPELQNQPVRPRCASTRCGEYRWQPSLNYSLSSQSHNEFWLSAVPFKAVAGRTQQLQVVRVICSAARARDDVINREVAERKYNSAAVADALL